MGKFELARRSTYAHGAIEVILNGGLAWDVAFEEFGDAGDVIGRFLDVCRVPRGFDFALNVVLNAVGGLLCVWCGSLSWGGRKSTTNVAGRCVES